MTKYHELEVDANRNKKRVGRGISGGQGKTAGRGTKGQKARTGKKLRPTFMGGQNPLMQSIPKSRGFKSIRVPAQVVYLDELSVFANKTVDNETLFAAGLISTPHHSVKIIARGEFSAKVTVKVQGASKSVQEVIKKSGGTFEKVPVPLKQSEKPKKKSAKK